jgi:hypothetical protein
MNIWQQALRADTVVLADFLEWIEEERQRLAVEGLHAPSWEALLAIRGQENFLANLSNSFTLADSEERQRAEYRRRNA